MASFVTFRLDTIQARLHMVPMQTRTVPGFPSQTVPLHSSKVGVSVLLSLRLTKSSFLFLYLIVFVLFLVLLPFLLFRKTIFYFVFNILLITVMGYSKPQMVLNLQCGKSCTTQGLHTEFLCAT